ncbi:MAG: hypothetical protein HUU55_01300 [Myxococcales bacterium]|nr:hypothetical protein [Myxococcales bacterium]
MKKQNDFPAWWCRIWIKPILAVGYLAAVLWAAPNALAADKKILCVFDPSGKNGDLFKMVEDYKQHAATLGVDFDLKPYTKESAAIDDLKAKKCHAVAVTGTRARAVNKGVGTLEAMGAIPDEQHVEKLIKVVGGQKAAQFWTGGATDPYEVAAVLPGGPVYLFVRDRKINTVEKLAGKKIATFDNDEAAKTMVNNIKARVVSADETSFASKFNNGEVDACYAPAVAYGPLELKKGMGTEGGVARYPIAQFIYTILIQKSEFPSEFAGKSRGYAVAKFKKIYDGIRAAEKNIPASAWIDIPEKDKKDYDLMFQKVRVELRDKGIYDKGVLRMMKNGVRCVIDKNRPECVDKGGESAL